MFKLGAVLLAGFLYLGGSPPADAADPAPDAAPDPRIALLKLLPAGSKIDELRPSPIAGIYEFSQGADVSYLTADGRYFLDGNLYDMGTRQNLTEERRTKARVAMLNTVPESQMLIFSPKNPLYTITVFTDVDCQYCRKLHSEMAELNKLGVRVRYMFYPRTGPNSESWHKAEAVWCSADRNAALTRVVPRRWRRNTRWGRASECAVLRPSSPRTAATSTVISRRMTWSRRSRSCRRESSPADGCPARAAVRAALFFEQLGLVFDAFPLFGIGGRVLLLADHRPLLGEFGVQLLEGFLPGRDFFLGVNCLHRAFRFAQRAVDAFVGIDDEKIRSLVETVHWADLHTIHIFALDAAFGHHERHVNTFSLNTADILPQPST